MGYLFEKLPVCFKGYFNRAVLPQNVSAVPLEQCIIKKEAYLKAGGIDLDKEPLERAIDFAGRLKKWDIRLCWMQNLQQFIRDRK